MSRPSALAHKVKSLLPIGVPLPDELWAKRHRGIVALLGLHVLVIPTFGLLRGFTPTHMALETLPVFLAAVVALRGGLDKNLRMGAATFGLLSSSAILVHLSGGMIEMHFHFFVMVAVITLYQSWLPFLLAIGYVVIHHGVMGALDPSSVYNHPAAIAHPWRWAAIHGFFIMSESAACLTAWRLNEVANARGEEFHQETELAQSDLEESLSLLTATLESTADGILVVDLEGRIVSFNQKFLELWNIPNEIVESRDDDRAIGFVLDQLKDPEAFVMQVRDLYSRPHAKSFDLLEFKDGKTFERYSQPQEVRGRSVGRVWSFRDVTERESAERRLQQAFEREREASQSLRALDEMKNAFLEAVSHELRTPLTSVLGAAVTLQKKRDEMSEETEDGMFDSLVRNARKLERLLSDLLDLDRLLRGVLRPRLEPTDINWLVTTSVEEVDAGDHPVALDVEEIVASIDAPKVQRIIENLVANAVKYTPAGTRIWVKVKRTEGGIVLSVEDEGPGVRPEFKQNAFEPFRRGNQAMHSPGTGIGLALVSRFAELHGGRAWIEDRRGGGAVFLVSLPCEVIEPLKSVESA